MLQGMTALVTGASSGIGRSTALALSRAGARLALCARREEPLAELAEQLGPDTRTFALDVRDRAGVAEALEGLEVDVLVNNAGLAVGLDPLHEGEPDDWDRMIDTNVRGLLNVSRAVLPGMVARNRGHVFNVGSMAGADPYANAAVYCASKAAVEALSTSLRKELVGTDLRVSLIVPGLTQTEFSLVRFKGDAARAEQPYERVTPLSGDDIADAIVWVAGRPAHVQIAEVVILPTAQAGGGGVARR